MMFTTLQLLIICLFPYLARLLSQQTVAWLSPVVLCYLMGILLANLSIFPIWIPLAEYFTQGTILLALPFLLYSTDLSSWVHQFKNVLLAFCLCVLCGIIGTLFSSWIFSATLQDAPLLAGMLAAVFCGGIPNMQAVGMALQADSELIVLLNAADIFVGGLYLVFLTSIAHSVLGLFLNNYKEGKNQMSKINSNKSTLFFWGDFLKGLGIALLIIGLAVGSSFLFFQELAATFIILSITTLSILASRVPWVHALKSTFEAGDYLLLMFCVAVGMLANFDNILENGLAIITFMAVAWGITVSLHWLLCFLFKIDRDTALIAGTAAIYGPVFIGQIASTIDNRSLVFPGIALGLLGIAMGNYVGIFVAWLA